MNLDSLRIIEDKVEKLVSRSLFLQEENNDLKSELTRLSLEMQQLRSDSKRLEAEKDELKKNSGDPEQKRILRNRLKRLLERLEKFDV